MSANTRVSIGLLMLLVGLVLVVGSVWLMKGPEWAGLVAGGILIYGTTLTVTTDD